jgi:predicted DNA binding CopG/RHH family protein
VGRPATGNAKMLIAIRIAPRVLAGLRRAAAKQHKRYQTYIHELLEKAVSKRVA